MLDAAREKNLRIATAESCTGGLIAACLTEIPGSSDVFDRGFVTYSNEAKIGLLGVPGGNHCRARRGFRETAAAMAKGALAQSHADIAVSCTGIAGPSGGTHGRSPWASSISACGAHGSRHCWSRNVASATSAASACANRRSRWRWRCYSVCFDLAP